MERRRNLFDWRDRRRRRLLSPLHDFSALRQERVFAVRPKCIRIRRRVDRLLQLIDPEATKAVLVQIPAELSVEADPAAFDRICANLIRNALQYGCPPVTVSAGKTSGMIWIECEDVGRGVEPSFVPKLFERFTRSSASALEREGSGIGLANALFYARAHRGDLSYVDRPGSGACFRLVLPDTPDGGGMETGRLALPRGSRQAESRGRRLVGGRSLRLRDGLRQPLIQVPFESA